MGSTSVTLNAAGQVVGQRRYEAYGQGRWSRGEEQTDFGFNSQREESEFGLYDYQARYFSPLLGRFISADSVVPDFSNPQALNRYAYVYNNPLKYIDPSGHCGIVGGGAGNPVVMSHSCLEALGGAAVAYAVVAAANQFDVEVDLDLNPSRPSSGAPVEDTSVLIFVLEDPTDAAEYRTVTLDEPEIPLFLPFPSDPPEILQEANAPAPSSVSPELRQPFFTSDQSVTPLGRASTGRTIPENLHEQLAMEEVMSNPQARRAKKLDISITDPRWPEAGWTKWTQNVNGVEIHYLYNQDTGEYDDFKFK